MPHGRGWRHENAITVSELAARVTAEGTHRVERVNGASRLHLGSRPGCAGYEREGHSARRLWAQSSTSGNSSRGPHQKNRSGRDLPRGTRRTRQCAHRNRAIASWTSLDVLVTPKLQRGESSSRCSVAASPDNLMPSGAASRIPTRAATAPRG